MEIGKQNKSHQEVNNSIKIRLSKKGLICAIVLIIVLLLALIIWRTRCYSKIYKFVMPASIEITVINSDTQQPIAGATIKVGDKTSTTNASGIAEITGLSALNTIITVTDTGYLDNTQTVKLKRKSNSLSVALVLNIEKTNLTISVKDFINDSNLSGAAVKIDSLSGITDTDGKFIFANLPSGEHTIELSKTGYNTLSQKVTVLKDNPLVLTLTPTGKVYFISNRENSKRGIYTSSYDGSDVTRLVAAVAGTEDYNISISPDKTKIAFMSTREKRANTDGVYVPDLFIVNTDGTKLTKLDGTFNIQGYQWTSDSKYLIWTSQADASKTASVISIYNAKNGIKDEVVSGCYINIPILSSDGTTIAWNQSAYYCATDQTGVFFRKLNSPDVIHILYNKESRDVNFSDNDKSITFSYSDTMTNTMIYKKYTIGTGAVTDYVPNHENDNLGKVMSPDKKHYAYVANRDGKTDIYISDLSGNNETNLTKFGTAGMNILLSWETNSQYIVFDLRSVEISAKYIVDISGGSVKKITDEYLDGGY